MAAMDRTNLPRRVRAKLLITALVVAGVTALASALLGSTAHADRSFGPSRQHASIRFAARTTSVRIFLVAIGDKGRTGTRIGCGDSLVSTTRRIAPTTTPLTAAMNLLLSDHHRYYGQSGLYNPFYQSRLHVKTAEVAHGTAFVYLVGTMRLGGRVW